MVTGRVTPIQTNIEMVQLEDSLQTTEFDYDEIIQIQNSESGYTKTIKVIAKKSYATSKALAQNQAESCKNCCISSGHMINNMFRSGECFLALGFVGIFFLICGVLCLLCAYQPLYIYGYCLVGISLLCSLTLFFSFGKNTSGHVLPREYVYELEMSKKEQALRERARWQKDPTNSKGYANNSFVSKIEHSPDFFVVS